MTNQSGKPVSRPVLYVFFGAFIVLGAGLSWPIIFKPTIRVIAARGWVETPCVILKSGVVEDCGTEGTVYKPQVDYTYSLDGVTHTGHDVEILAILDGNYDNPRTFCDRFPAGSKRTCFVNPEATAEAVLVREWRGSYLLVGLIPTGFLLAGLLGWIAVLRKKI